LARRLKVDAKECLVTLLALADVFYRVDVERNGEAMDGQDNGRRFSIDENLKEE
jgi:hypothetical protein